MAGADPSPPPPNPSIVSSVAFDRFAGAEGAAGPSPAFPAPAGAPKQSARDWMRSFVDELSNPAQPSPAEARAALYIAGLMRVEVDPEDERLRAILAPTVTLSVKGLQEMTGLPAASVRRAAQVLRDEGRLIFDGPGRYRVPEAPIWWPETDRSEGWVMTRGGMLYAF